MGRILAIDYGLKRIGLAMSDPMRILASPLSTLQAGKNLEETVQLLLKEISPYEINQIVIGLPYLLSGIEGSQAQEVKLFGAKLEEKSDIPIIFWDERLTTTQAERVMKEGGLSRKKRTKSIDQMAAVLILQSYLDSR